MYKDLKQSVENLINVDFDQKRLERFSIERYNEKFPDQRMGKININYTYFKVIDENTIRIFFRLDNSSDGENYDSFDIDMRSHYRDEKLNMLDI